MISKRVALIALISGALIGLEIIWTRIFSAEFYYPFAFLILSLAILGLGLGALSLRLFPAMNTAARVPALLSAAGVFALSGPLVALHIGLDFTLLFAQALMMPKFILILLFMTAPFYCGGMVLAMIFRQHHYYIGSLYMADLFGAAGGVFTAIILMNACGTPTATFLFALPLVLAALISCGSRRQAAVPILLLALMGFLAIKADRWLERPMAERAPVVYKRWDAMAKLKVYEFDENYRGFNIDNLANSPIAKFDGNWNRPDSEKFGFGIEVSYLISRTDSCTFLSLGAGGGNDVLQALQYGCTEIHAVEVNPLVNKLMTHGELADYAGNIYQDSRVKVITEDARAYVRRFEDKFDVIFSLSSNTFAALASGSFALAENYLFTTEAFTDYYRALSQDGFLMMEHQFYMPRLVSEVTTALAKLGVESPAAHVAFYDLPKMRRNIMLLSKQPLTDEIRQHAFGPLTSETFADIHLLYPVTDSLRTNPINRIVDEGWKSVQRDMPTDISPCNDNRPFVAQLGLMKNFEWGKLSQLRMAEFRGFPLSKLILLTVLLVTLVLILPLTLAPYAKEGVALSRAAWFFFFVIGMGFMIIEVVLIQKYTLFIGPSYYALVTILFTLLLASGLGSRFSQRIPDYLPFIVIILWLFLEIFALTPLKYALGNLTVWLRILASVLLIFPLGFFMGMPFPKAVARVGELVDWGFAVNGAASVMGSVIVMMVAINFGFSWAIAVAACCYVVAAALLRCQMFASERN